MRLTHNDWPERSFINRSSWHFHRRLYERYHGLVLLPGAYTDIGRQIREGEAIKLTQRRFAVRVRRPNSRKIVWVVVVYSGHLMTALTPKAALHDLRRRKQAIKEAMAHIRQDDQRDAA